LKALTAEQLKQDNDVRAYIEKANEYLGELGFTEHGLRHANLVSHIAENVLLRLDRPRRAAELAAIAGYLHDIGNIVGRPNHAQNGALMAWDILRARGVSATEVAIIVSAIGNHEEDCGQAVNDVAAALILGDKSDVHRSRVQAASELDFDVHDKVNYAVRRSFLRVEPDATTITLELDVDTELSSIMDYFEIFLDRMVMCRRAAAFLRCNFELSINGVPLL